MQLKIQKRCVLFFSMGNKISNTTKENSFDILLNMFINYYSCTGCLTACVSVLGLEMFKATQILNSN